MTPITYVDHDPLIPTHLGTDAPHVHHLGSDRCLRIPDGEHCPSPAELRAENERLHAGALTALGRHVVRLAAEMERAESAEAERDALQRRLAEAEQRAEYAYDIGVRHVAHGHSTDGGETWVYSCLAGCGVWPCEPYKAATIALMGHDFGALGGPAAPPQEPQPTPEAEDICPCSTPGRTHVIEYHDAAPPQEPQPTPEATCTPECAPHLYQFCSPRCEAGARQSVSVERITDANGDETERGADTDTETTHQQDEEGQA